MTNIKEREVKNEYREADKALNVIKTTDNRYPDDGLALHTDLYQINMAETYWDDGLHNRRAIFEAYFRKMPFDNGYVVAAGLERIIDYLQNYHFTESDIAYLHNELGYEYDYLDFLKTVKFDGNLKAAVEGELVYANEPLLRVDSKLALAQLIETPILNILNFHPLIATKAARIRAAVDGEFILVDLNEIDKQSISEFGTRRAHELDAAFYGTRAAYIGGFNATSNVRAGKVFGIPVVGTHAHAMVQVYGDEYTAFKKFAKRHKNCIFLVDTYDTLKSGVPNAIKVARELGDQMNFVGIRLDSGNLCELSKKARKMLDEAGFPNAKIFASNDLDEYEVKKLKETGAKIDGWGIGTKVITAYDQPALGVVYKLVALEDENGNMVDTIKLSETPDKATTPGLKKILRITNLTNNKNQGDIIAMEDEEINLDENIQVRDIHADIFKDGQLVYEQPTIKEMREYCMKNLRMLQNATKTIENPEKYPVNLTKKCYENKLKNVEKAVGRIIA